MDLSAEQLGALDARAIKEFGLRLSPFSSAVSAFYDGAQRRHCLETLRHLAIFGDMTLFLTGESGAGKTRLLEEFSRLYGDEINVLMLSAYAGATKQSCLVRLALLSGLATIENESAHQTLSRLVQKYDVDCQKSGKRTVWVIDDAEQLPEAELKLFLAAFNELSPDSGVVILFAGSSELVARATELSPNEHHQNFHQVVLKPLLENEAIEYLQMRLQFSGYQNVLDMEEDQRERLMSLSKGLPGQIHQAFLSVLFHSSEDNDAASEESRNVSQKILFGITGLLVLSFLFVSYQHGLFNAADQQDKKNLAMEQQAFEVKRLEQAQERDRAAREAAARLAMLDHAIEKQNGELNKPVEVTESDEPMARAGVGIGSNVSSDAPDLSLIAKEKVIPEVSNEVIEAEISENEKTVESRPDDVQDNILDNSERHASYRSSPWVKEQASFYTLQVLGSYNEETARKFVDGAPANNGLVYIESLYKGKPWFVVLYGSFESKELARDGLKRAPQNIRKQKPWLRSFAAIIESLPE